MAPVNITASINTIPMLNSLYFKSWKQNLEIVLGMMDLDLTLREDFPPALTDKSTSEEKREKERGFVKNEQAEIGTLLTSLHWESQFKVSYNCQKEAWSLNKLISHCVQEEERLKQDKTKCAYFALTSKAKDKGNARFFEDVGFVGEDKVKDIIEKEYVDNPMGTIDIVQDLVPNSVDGTIDQDNVIEPPFKKLLQKNKLQHLQNLFH
ncbi:UNVERIFIED_CONTAM: hypothetical protein Scaly_3076700 [Sesamum calycinum]|uniref:Retrotransposon Copia-like N-terminal domain-containing protein n=1 Tax=Sesamum calycinum TaxID=2727403 RepID=A0AAW2JTT9_9LAMI